MNAQPAHTLHDVSLAPILDALHGLLPEHKQSIAEPFVNAFFARLSPEEYAVHTPAEWAALARSVLDLARQRQPGEVLVRLFNPTVEEHGWASPHTVLQAVNDDMPFLVDSVGMAMAQADISIHVLGHPVVAIERDADGRVIAAGQGIPESLLYLEIDRQTPGEDFARIEASVRKALQDVRVIVGDWARMRDRMSEIAEELARRPMPVSRAAREETQDFLRWAANNHFTFFGYREYEVVAENNEDVLRAVPGTGLGLLRGTDKHPPRPLGQLAAHSMHQSGATEALILTKTNARSSVHRSGYMDYIGVLSFDENDRAVREERFLGLYTSSAYAYRPWDIPVVRQRYDHVMTRSGLVPGSHSGKALRNILEMLPRDELFQSSEDDLYRTATGILGLQERVRPKLFLRRDPYGRFFSALAFVPRDRFNTDTRLRIEQMLKTALNAEQIDTSIQVGESPLAQLHLIARPKAGAQVDFDADALDAELGNIVRNWHDELRDQVVAKHGEQDGLRMANHYGRALPMAYIEEVTPAIAANDVEQLAALSGPDDLRLSLCRAADRQDGQGALRFKLYRQNSDIPLSDVLPMMENMGLRVISEHPYRIEIDGQPVYIQDFEVEASNAELDVSTLDETFEEAFSRIWRGDAENDGFNRLILDGGLDWRQVAMLRGYNKYLLQVGVPFSQTYVEETLAKHPLLARLLVELFEAKFDPCTGGETPEQIQKGAIQLQQQLHALAGDEAAQKILRSVLDARSAPREQQVDSTRSALKGLLDRVSSLDEDRILRSYISVIDATLRTNYYQLHDGKPAHYISFKFDSDKVPDLPKPKPFREIFVYSPRVEGIHLRFGPVARGGLRWSDRREDFRTEVLGLVKAQMVKNTVIVPVGAKGGFFVKKSPVGGDRDAVMAEGVACYKMFIHALLDITDNLVDGKVAHPQNVVRHDTDDPYLVVAADKGTATFSDIANGIAAEHDFWLGDAFASGGSVGYDHKGMGITAKGAWESVKRHFRAMGRDSQTQDFTVVGVGDMSGDVFGNGMLLSKHIRLLAAFDHRHIFLDPNPDAARSFVERERMFALPRSSWEDYDKSLISAGGGLFPRTLKSIALTPEIKASLGIDDTIEAMSPAELMNAILKAPVDLLWNGGIGTYVKASFETHADVGDRANNALRVDGRDLRCKVIGEGGNLGVTQNGRVEAAREAHVLLNTDFIDNSAGVDTSDHEVNIKILLNGEVQANRLTLEARNTLLASMTDEVADLVLNDNYRQNQAISLMERMSVSRLGSKQHFIRTLESEGLLDRQIEFLPSDAELAERKARGEGLTRPELSTLLSYAKLVLFQRLLDSDVPEDAFLSKELVRYFPIPLQHKYAAAMENHRLKREIIATAVTNSMVNRMGATFTLRMQEDTGRTSAEVAEAYTTSREALDTRDLWAQIDALDGQVPEAVQIDALLEIWNLLRSMSRWLLSRPGALPDIAAAVDRYRTGILAIRAALPALLPRTFRTDYDAHVAAWQQKGLSPELSAQLAALRLLDAAPDIVEVAAARTLQPVDVAKAYYGLGDALNLSWLREQIDALPVEGRWHAHARGVLRDELAAQQRALVGQVLSSGKGSPEQQVEQWLQRDDPSLRFTQSMFAELVAQKSLDYPTVSVAVRRLAQMAAAAE